MALHNKRKPHEHTIIKIKIKINGPETSKSQNLSRNKKREKKSLPLKREKNNQFPSIKNNGKVRNLKNINEGDEESSQIDHNNLPKPSSGFGGENRNPLYKRQGEEHIPPPGKFDERILTTVDTGEDQILAQYSTGETEIPPKTMRREQATSRNKKDEDRIPPENKGDGEEE